MKKTYIKKTSKKTSAKTRLSYFKFVPAIVISIMATLIWSSPGTAINQSRTDSDVLAYATNISHSGLLASTNSHRANNGAGALSLNSQLNAAAQAKAQDMVNRNYWSHQTPDGQQPWVFITNAGYQYQAAGENLAYGFMTSNSTVTGWMNSPSHKSNMLDANFTEVGFGYANSANFVANGQQTVVVAMYAKPLAAQPANSVPAAPPSASQPVKQSATSKNPAPQTPVPAETEIQQAESAPVAEPQSNQDNEAVEPIATTSSEQVPPTSSGQQQVKKVQLLTGGSAAWSATFVVLFVCSTGLLWSIHKGIKFGKLLKSGENFIVHHIHLDLTVLAVVYLGFVLLSGSGFIR